MPTLDVHLIEIARIQPGEFERRLDPDHVANLARDIKENGLHQPIGVIPRLPGFVRSWGQHRCAALELLSETHVPAVVVPEDADELLYSLTENNLRLEESMEAMVARVSALAQRHACTFHDAALEANVNPSKFTRCKKIVDKLAPEAKQLAEAHELGMSDLYLVATHAPSPAAQLEALQARVNGMSRDELADWLKARRTTDEKSQPTTKRRSHKIALPDLNAELHVNLPSEFDGPFIMERMRQLKCQLKAIRKQSQPARRLPRPRA